MAETPRKITVSYLTTYSLAKLLPEDGFFKVWVIFCKINCKGVILCLQ